MSFFWKILIFGKHPPVKPRLWPYRRNFPVILGLGLALLTNMSGSAIAQSTPRSFKLAAAVHSQTPLDRQLLTEQQNIDIVATPGACATETAVITSKTVCQDNLTIPSLWWFDEQYREANGKLVDTWLAYPDQAGRDRRVDVVVNQQVWSLLDYLERYEFVTWFGSVARDYRFNTRVFNNQGTLLAAYTCEFQVTNEAGFPTCRLFVDSLGRDGLGRPTTPLAD